MGSLILCIIFQGIPGLVQSESTVHKTMLPSTVSPMASHELPGLRRHANSSSWSKNFTAFLQQYHPNCFPSQLRHNLWDHFDPAFIRKPSFQRPRYDHQTCFVMKARYNCALSRHEDSDVAGIPPFGESFDFEMVLLPTWRAKLNNSLGAFSGHNCNLNGLVKDMGGPMALATFGADIPAGRLPAPATAEKISPQFTAVVQGNSYLRGVWEALVCGFSNQITYIQLLSRGPKMSQANILIRNGTLLGVEDLGTPISQSFTEGSASSDDFAKQGCHAPGRSAMFQYYWPNVTVPPSLPGCSDDMAVVEFGKAIRFVFLFHPSRFQTEALRVAYERLGIAQQRKDEAISEAGNSNEFPIDLLVWNGGEMTHRMLAPQRIIQLDDLLPRLVTAQNRSVGRFFGANNPWISNPPDNVSVVH